MKNTKRIIATVLTAVMMISMLPSSVFAAELDAYDVVEPAVEAVSVPAEEQEIESTVEDISVEDAEEVQGSSEEIETVDAADPEAADVIEDTEAPVVTEEKTTIEAEGKDYVVTVTYDASALLPDDVKVTAEEIKANAKKYDDYCDQALEAVQQENADVEELSYARLFDIKLVDAAGNVLEPASAVDVQIRLKDVESVEDGTQVVHFAGEEETPEVIEPTVENDTVAFATEGFSIYAVIGTGDYERMTVNFYGADTDEPIETMFVKKADKTNGQLDSIIYDPNIGALEGRYAFYGWYIGDPNYEVEDCVNAEGEPIGKTIDDVKDYIKELDFSDGDILNVYAMLLTYYRVDYIDGEGISLGSDRALVKEEGADADYIVNKQYSTDSQHHFEGWLPVDGASNITEPAGATDETRFQNETPIKIKGDVKFSVDVAEGNWLVFDENGKQATYNAPRFIYTGYKPSDPEPEGGNVPDGLLEMKRKGYTFGGWLTEDGEEFDFDQPLNGTTTAYAKWDPVENADYTIIIWKEGLDEGTWDFEKSLTLNGQVGTNIDTVIETIGSGRDRYARIDGTTYQYTGFSYDHHDQNKTIAPEGNTLVNVYYGRNTYTLRFFVTGYILGIPLRELDPITAKYGADISSHFPMQGTLLDWPSWVPGVNYLNSLARWNARKSDTFKNVVVAIDTMPAEDVIFDSDRETVSQKAMYYYIEALPGENVDYNFNGKNFILYKGPVYARFNYFTTEDFMDIAGCQKYGTEPAFPSGSNPRIEGQDTLRCFYTRQFKHINYLDGAYFDGNGNRISFGTSNLGVSEEIPFASDISSYNKGGEDYYEPECPEDGFVLEGWYVDQACTYPCTFTKMSSSDITVYAKWRQIQYRVFLESQADGDTTLYWGSENQAMNFRVSYGDKISAPEGERTGYKFLGWHKDAAGNNPVYLEGLVLNESTVTEAYDKTKDFTDPWNKYGQRIATTNADVERFWITKKFVLYASWSKIVTGAEGIGIVYDLNGGSGTIEDRTLYQDNTNAVAAGAPSAPDGKVFKGWVVQRWNGTAFEDTDVRVLPGRNFKVLLDNAKVVIEGSVPEQIVTPEYVEQHKDEHYNYTIQVKAVYEDKPVTVPTHITWYTNYASDDPVYRNDTTGANGKPLKINEAVSVYGLGDGENIPERLGYNFLGWAKDTERVNATDSANITTSKKIADFLVYNDGEYYLPTDTAYANAITEVAADELTPYEALYAIWEYRPHFTIYHSATKEKEVIYFTDEFPEGSTLDLTTAREGIYSGVTEDYLYGGYYEYINGEKGDPYTSNGMELNPVEGTTYYLKEVPQDYLRTQAYVTYRKADPKVLRSMWFLTALDADKEYEGFGFIVNNKDMTERAQSGQELVIMNANGTKRETKTAYTVTTRTKEQEPTAVIVAVDASDSYLTNETIGEGIEVKAYHITPDHVKVIGNVKRTFKSPDLTYTNIEAGAITNSDPMTAMNSEGPSRMLSARKKLTINSNPEETSYTVTKVDNGKKIAQTVKEGDNTGKITWAGKTNYVFAGWYEDASYSKAADFSNVKQDMTVYAKYVKASTVKLSFAKKAVKAGEVTLKATLKISNQPDIADTAVECTYKDNAYAVEFTGVKRSSSTHTYTGTVKIGGLENNSTFTAVISYKTPDGTIVNMSSRTCKYNAGAVTVK